MEKKWYNSTFAIILRWIFFIPLATLGGTVGSNILVLLQKWSIGLYLDVDSFVMKYVFTFINGSAFAGFFIYLSIRLIPKNKKVVFIITYIAFTLIQIWLLYFMASGDYYIKLKSDISAQEADVINLCGTIFGCFYLLYVVVKDGHWTKNLDEFIESI
jgi:hypothetical protein